jgi:hypothetical protein
MADFNWVPARAKCSLELLFQRLKTAATRNVDQMNATLAREQRLAKCEIADFGDRFLVSYSGNFAPRTVEFKMDKGRIQILGGDELSPKFSATPTLNAEGDCKLLVEGSELDLWQVRRKALDNLFFGS